MSEIYVRDAILAGSCAIRTDVYKELSGYREEWSYAGEEEEFSARMLQHGYVVRFGRSDPILHYVSPGRSVGEISYYTARNSILFCLGVRSYTLAIYAYTVAQSQ